MLKNLTDRLFRRANKNGGNDNPPTNLSDSSLISKDLQLAIKTIEKELRTSKKISSLTDILNMANIDQDILNGKIEEIRNDLPSEFDTTVRILRWDGKIMGQKGTVISIYSTRIPLETFTGEFALEVVISERPLHDVKFRILWIGLDYAGKTTLLHKLRYNEFIKPNRTVGQDLEDVILDGLKITNIDLGGQKALRQYWGKFPLIPNLIVFVVDISDEDRFTEVYEELKVQIIENEKYNKVPIVILINKIDEYSLTKDPIAHVLDKIDLMSLIGERTWHLQAVSALTGAGLDEFIEIGSKILLSETTV